MILSTGAMTKSVGEGYREIRLGSSGQRFGLSGNDVDALTRYLERRGKLVYVDGSNYPTGPAVKTYLLDGVCFVVEGDRRVKVVGNNGQLESVVAEITGVIPSLRMK